MTRRGAIIPLGNPIEAEAPEMKVEPGEERDAGSLAGTQSLGSMSCSEAVPQPVSNPISLCIRMRRWCANRMCMLRRTLLLPNLTGWPACAHGLVEGIYLINR